jgi:purine-binding chemotaxis protein CheW
VSELAAASSPDRPGDRVTGAVPGAAAGAAPDSAADDAARLVLEARARALARPIVAAARGAEGGEEMVVFTLARERYAVASQRVLAVTRLRTLTPLPGALPPVVGVTAWRGLVLTLVDLRALTGAVATGLDDLSYVLVLGAERPIVGVLADAVEELVRFAPDDVLRLPELRAGVEGARLGALRGVTRDARLVLDAERLLALFDESPSLPSPVAPP